MRCGVLLARLLSGPLPVEEGERLLGSGNNLKVQVHLLRRDGWPIEMVRGCLPENRSRGKGVYLIRESSVEAA